MSVYTLSFESECKHCHGQTAFSALSVPVGLSEKQVAKLAEEREVDCCYTCYELYEQAKPKLTKV